MSAAAGTPGPVGPAGAAIARAWQQLRRRQLQLALDVETYGVPDRPGATLVAANHASAQDEEILRSVWPGPLATLARGAALRRGTPALVFPEGGTSPDGSVGAFAPAAFEPVVAAWARGSDATVTPVALSGTHALTRQRPWGRGQADRARVTVRCGTPIARHETTAAALAEQVRSAVVALLAEDRATWWDAARGRVAEPGPAPSWREAWRQRGDTTRPGQARAPRIWG